MNLYQRQRFVEETQEWITMSIEMEDLQVLMATFHDRPGHIRRIRRIKTVQEAQQVITTAFQTPNLHPVSTEEDWRVWLKAKEDQINWVAA